MDKHNTIYTLNKDTLRIETVYINECNKELKEFLELNNYLFNDYAEAVKKQSYFDTMVKFN